MYNGFFYVRVSGYYIHSCQKSSPNVNECLTYAANHLAMHLRKGQCFLFKYRQLLGILY